MLRIDDRVIEMSKHEARKLADLLEKNGYTSLPAALDIARNVLDSEGAHVYLVIR